LLQPRRGKGWTRSRDDAACVWTGWFLREEFCPCVDLQPTEPAPLRVLMSGALVPYQQCVIPLVID
jgi:hypothetical protein